MEIYIGHFKIQSASTAGKLWLENKIGEGMSIDETIFEAGLEEWFNKHF